MHRRIVLGVLLLVLLVVPHVFSNSNQQHKHFVTAPNDVVISGNAIVRSALNGNIVVIVDQSLSNEPDGVPDLVFRFARKDGKFKDESISLDLQRVRVFYSSRRLAVISEDGHVMVSLSLEKIKRGDAEFAVYGDRSSDLRETVRISRGIGLQRQNPRRADDGSYLPVNVEEGFVFGRGDVRAQEDEFGIEGCQAGGTGSTSCSIDCGGGQGCSVSCSSGFHSCCNCPHDCGCKLGP
jgi:hypothetical protein